MEVDWAWASERRAGASGSGGDDDDDVRSFFGSTVRIENNWRAEAVSFFGICQQPTPHKRTLAKKGEDNFAAAAAALSESGGRSRRQSNND